MALGKFGPDQKGNGLLLVAFCCGNCSGKAGQMSKAPFIVNGVNVRLAVLACSSKLAVLHILRALETGADAVALWTCGKLACRFGRGWARAAKRVDRARVILDQIGIGGQRVFITELSPTEADGLDRSLTERAEELTKLGPSPLKSAGAK